MNRLPGNRFALAALVVLGLVALYGVASLIRPAASAPPRAISVPVTSAVAVCPDPGGSRVSAVTPPGSHAAGQARATGVPVALTTPGTFWSADIDRAIGPWTFAAYGSLAPGLTVEQTTSHGGLAGIRCTEPATDQWFVGPGPADAADVGLYLTNVDDRPVSVVVAGLGSNGSLEIPAGEDDIVVGPRSTRLVQVGVQVEGLGDAAAGTKIIALHVRATSGRIAAAVRVQRKTGADWLPATAPGDSVVVPGVPPGDGRRRLLVAVPGRDVATVKVQVISSGGGSASGAPQPLQAAAMAVTPYDLGLGGRAAGLRLVADRPIVAAVVSDEGDDFAVTAADRALSAGDHVVGLVADGRDTTTLLLTAPGPAATVRLTQISKQGPAGSTRDVTVPAARTIEVTMPLRAGGEGYGLSLVPRPRSGPVYAACLLRIRKQGITLLPVAPARTSVILPPVADVPVP